jgi:hypothetical protein
LAAGGTGSATVIGLIVGAEGFLALFVFFLAYFVAYEPYRALYPDLVSDEIAGRGQSTQAVWRGAGTGLALVGGGLLYGVGRAAPFLASAVLAAVSMFRWWGRLARSSRKGGPAARSPRSRRGSLFSTRSDSERSGGQIWLCRALEWSGDRSVCQRVGKGIPRAADAGGGADRD